MGSDSHLHFVGWTCTMRPKHSNNQIWCLLGVNVLATSRSFDNLTSSVCCWDTRLQSEIHLGPLKGKKASGKIDKEEIKIKKVPGLAEPKRLNGNQSQHTWRSGLKKKSSHHYVHIWSGELCQSFHWNIPNIHWPLWLKENAAPCWKVCWTSVFLLKLHEPMQNGTKYSECHTGILKVFIYLFIFAVNTKNIFVAR